MTHYLLLLLSITIALAYSFKYGNKAKKEIEEYQKLKKKNPKDKLDSNN